MKVPISPSPQGRGGSIPAQARVWLTSRISAVAASVAGVVRCGTIPGGFYNGSPRVGIYPSARLSAPDGLRAFAGPRVLVSIRVRGERAALAPDIPKAYPRAP